jgi:SulP family sulfate permease
MTATIVDDLTDTSSDRDRECKGQGIANVLTGFLGGMAGCAMIGQSIINIKSGGRGRLSTLVAGIFLLILVVFMGPWISQIPMAALVAIMIMVSIGTFSWSSITKAKENPTSNNIVMITTVVIVVWTHNLAYGVLAGVMLAALFFANKIGHFMYVSTSTYNEGDENVKKYEVHGQVFFNSTEKFLKIFDYKEVVDKIIINLDRAHFWDTSAVSALDKVVYKLRREGATVEIIGLNEASQTIIDRFGIYDNPEEIDKIMGGGH